MKTKWNLLVVFVLLASLVGGTATPAHAQETHYISWSPNPPQEGGGWVDFTTTYPESYVTKKWERSSSPGGTTCDQLIGWDDVRSEFWQSGDYLICLTIYPTWDFADAISYTQVMTVTNLPPVIDGTYYGPRGGMAYYVSASTYDQDWATLVTCTVDYGDGTGPQPGELSLVSCTGPDHTYAAEGTYTATITLSEQGFDPVTATITFNVTNVSVQHVFTWSPGSPVVGEDVTFSLLGTAPPPEYSFLWTRSSEPGGTECDATLGTEAAPVTSFAAAGDYMVCLAAFYGGEPWGTDSQIVTVVGAVSTYTISGTLFNDLDGDGLKDTGEEPLVYWEVRLDQGCDGSSEFQGETNELGQFSFADLTAGLCYRLLTNPYNSTDWTQTTTLDDITLDADKSFEIGMHYTGLVFSPERFLPGEKDVAYNQTMTVSGGTPAYTITVNEQETYMPPGVDYEVGDDTITVSGTPTQAGVFGISFNVKDSGGLDVGSGSAIIIRGADATFTFTSALNPSVLGQEATFLLEATGLDPGNEELTPYGLVTFYADGNPIQGCVDLVLIEYYDNEEWVDHNPVECKTASLTAGDHIITADFSADSGGIYNDATGLVLEGGHTVVETGYTISGTAFYDSNSNWVMDVGEVGLAGVAVRFDAGCDASVNLSVSTAADGSYSAVLPGGQCYRITAFAPSMKQTTPVEDILSADASGVNIGLVEIALAVDKDSLPDGIVGEPYNQTITVSGGTAPYTFLNLNLPEGWEYAVDENAGTLTLFGTPAAYGDVYIGGVVQDASGASLEFGYSLYIRVKVNLALNSVPNPSMPGDTVTFSLDVSGPDGELVGGTVEFYDGAQDLAGCEQTFWVDIGMTSVECSTASLAAGVHQIKATYDPLSSGSIYAHTEATLEHTVVTPVTITVGPETISQGQVGVDYSQQFIASGGAEPYTFSSTGALPGGLNLSTDGLLSGTPAETGDFPITVVATDSESATGSRDYILTINPAPPITVLPETLPDGFVDEAYSVQFSASSGTEPYTFSLQDGNLPAGLGLSEQGLLSGTPAETGDFPITVTATDAAEESGSRDYTLTINPARPLTLMPETLSDGLIGESYSVQFTAVNGVEPYTFDLLDGDLPYGLNLSADGLLSGTPDQTGTWEFEIQVTDSSSPAQTDSRVYTLEVTALSISGTLFNDTDRDGTLDSGETGLPNMHVYYDQGCDGSWDTSVDSDAQGSYTFDEMAANQKYCIGAVPVPGYTRTTQPVTIDSLTASMTGVNFGYVANSLLVSPTEIPDPVLKGSYSETVAVSGGTPDYTFTQLHALMPAGLSISFVESTGVLTISGKPTALGQGEIFGVVTDANNDEALIDLNFAVMGDVTLTLISDNNPSMQTESVTFSLAVDAPTGGQYPAPRGEVTFSEGDAEIVGCTGLQLGVEEGASNPVTCTISTLSTGTHTITAGYSDYTDTYRNTSTTIEQVVNADATPPQITPEIQGTQGANDWYTSNVTLTWSVSDPETGIASSTGCEQVTVTTDQQAPYTCTATNGAGSQSSQTVDINRDATAPTVSITADRTPDVYGWYNKTIDFAVSGNDVTSGIESCDPNFSYSSPDKAAAAVSASCTDLAGNKGTSSYNFQYDGTKPVVALTGVTEGGVYVQGSVPVAGCTTTDALAGVLTQATISTTGGDPDGLGNFTATCSGGLDNAGNAGDPAIVHYRVVSASSYILAIDKTTNGADGLNILVGAPVTWQYVVTNVSSGNLTNIVVTDNKLGQVCKINRLAPQASRTCTKTGVAVAGPYSNTGTATVLSGGTTYTASDDSSYFGAAPAIDVEKLVSVDLGVTWEDADSPTGPNAIVGDPVQFKFIITNTGNIALSNITLSDTDLSLPTCSTPTTLAAGSSYGCVVEIPATIGQHTNTATATGVYGGITYTDSDNANYHGGNAIEPDIAINSLTITINKARTTVSGQFVITDETKDGTTPDGFLVDLTDYGLGWEAKAAKTNVFASVIPSGGCTYNIVAVDYEHAAGWHSGDPITFDETVTIGYTCTFGPNQLPAGGTLRGTAWAYIFDQMDMEYTFIATKVIPK